MIGLNCNSCSNGTCGNCVEEKLQTMGFIQNAKYHCLCASKGHSNNISKENPNKTILHSKKDTEPPREAYEYSNDFWEEN